MKSLTEHLWFEVKGRRGFVNITSTVADLVLKSGVNEGLCLVNAMHITATFTSNKQSSAAEKSGQRLSMHSPSAVVIPTIHFN